MNVENKIKLFDYFISQIILKQFGGNNQDLQNVVRDNISECGLNKLKLLKLLFLASTIKTNQGYLLDNIFDNFYAMPYGPVESDVQDNLYSLNNYIVSDQKIELSQNADLTYLGINQNYKENIEESIDYLFQKNNKILTMPTFDLIELTRQSDSWRIIFTEAQRNNKNSLRMSNEIIKTTTTYYLQ